MNDSQHQKHPWEKGRLNIITVQYLKDMNIDVKNIEEELITQLEQASRNALENFQLIGNVPPLLKLGEELKTRYVDIPEGFSLSFHNNTPTCPKHIIEVNPTLKGCHLNCQYCLAHARIDTNVITEVQIFKNYDVWFRQQLRKLRVENDRKYGTMYYISPRTEFFSPRLIKDGVTEGILLAFKDHMEEETRRLGKCLDTLMIVTKGGVNQISTPGPKGYTVLELLKSFPDNVQVSLSITHFKRNEALRDAIEPGAPSVAERLEMVRTLQKEEILIQGALTQPLFHVFPPDQHFWEDLYNAGIRRISVDLLTLTLKNLALIAQIIGWFDKAAEKDILEAYLNTDAPSKDGFRRGISMASQRQFFSSVIDSAKKANLYHASYCRFIQNSVGLPRLDYREPSSTNSGAVGGCLANIGKPTPEIIREKRLQQLQTS